MRFNNILRFLNRNRIWILLIVILIFAPSETVYADAASKINELRETLSIWIRRLGGAAVLIGGVRLGLAVKDDSAETKTKAIQIIMCGCIIIAIAQGAYSF